jgi:hypothetical protein
MNHKKTPHNGVLSSESDCHKTQYGKHHRVYAHEMANIVLMKDGRGYEAIIATQVYPEWSASVLSCEDQLCVQ